MKVTPEAVRQAYPDRTHTLAEWADILGVSPGTLIYHAGKLGLEMRVPRLAQPRQHCTDDADWQPPAWSRPAEQWSEARRAAERRRAEMGYAR